ncbi:MAG: NUDIX domain-containing protein [Clostridiaceae bacterium]|nr:NUDIX domain-containing protein [Clostridiaceae bacterium]
MGEHYRTLSAIFPVILRTANDNQQVLLHQRANTGYMDGMWDFAGSGHVDDSETARQAVVRECKEELGITVKIDDISFAHLSHRLGNSEVHTYYDIYFIVHSFCGNPSIAEPQKCTGLEWFDINHLPENMIVIRKLALAACLKSSYYSEIIN